MLVGIDHVEADMAVQNLRHQGVDGASAGGNRVQHIGAFRAGFDCILDGFHLPAYATNAVQQLLFVPDDMSYILILYPGGYSSEQNGNRPLIAANGPPA
jgi:hypothetical protein